MSMHWIMRVYSGAQAPWEQNLRYIERRAPGQNREPVVGCGVPPSYRARTMPCRARLQIKYRREPGDVFHPYHPRAIGQATEAEVRSQGGEKEVGKRRWRKRQKIVAWPLRCRSWHFRLAGPELAAPESRATALHMWDLRCYVDWLPRYVVECGLSFH